MDTITLRTNKVERLIFRLYPDHDLDTELKVLAASAKEKWGDRIIYSGDWEMHGISGVKMVVDGVPIRYREAHSMPYGELVRSIDAMGYPQEAVVGESLQEPCAP